MKYMDIELKRKKKREKMTVWRATGE